MKGTHSFRMSFYDIVTGEDLIITIFSLDRREMSPKTLRMHISEVISP